MENPPQGEEEFEVKLTLAPAQAEQLTHGSGVLAIAEALSLDPADEDDVARATAANEQMISAKARAGEIDKMRREFIEPARLIIERAQNRFMPTINALKQAEEIFKKKLQDWQSGRKLIADQRQKEAEDKARKEREEQQRRDAAERAEREQREKEARDAAARAEAERVQKEKEAEEARKANDPIALAAAERAARKAAEEKARQEESERQLQEENERRTREQALAASAALPPPPPAAAAPKLAGFGSRENWIAAYKDGETEDSVKLKIIRAIAGVAENGNQQWVMPPRTELLALLDLSDKQIKAMAKAQKQHTNIPGMVTRDEPVAVSRTRKP